MVAKLTGLQLLQVLPKLRENFVLEYERLQRLHGDLLWFGWPLNFYLALHPRDVEHVLLKNAKNYKKSRTYQGLKPLLGEGLVTAEGDVWKQSRALVAPEFTKPRALVDVGLTVACAERWLAQGRWFDASEKGLPGSAQVVRIDEAALDLGFSLAAETLFGSEAHEAAGEVSRHLNRFMQHYIEQSLAWVKTPGWLPSRSRQAMQESVEALNAVLDRVVLQAQEAAGTTNVLQRLLAARKINKEAALGERFLRDQMVTLLMAGHETTANSLSFTLFALSENPDAQQRLHTELTSVLGAGPPTAASLEALDYCEACILESLRLYPAVPGISREALDADVLSRHPIPAGSRVELSPWVTQRNPEFWPDAARFRPERFLVENRKQHGFAYFPFGGGPRTCVGAEMAKAQLKVLLSLLVRRYHFELEGPAPTPQATVTLRPQPALFLRVTQRQ